MKRFNIAKEQRKLNRKNNIANNIKIRTIILSIFILVGSIMLFTYSKYNTTIKLDVMHSKVEELNIINYYIDDVLTNNPPEKNSGYVATNIVCDNNATGEWDDDEWDLIIESSKAKNECSVYFEEFEYSEDFDYTGDVQTFTVPKTGTYKLEVWGAQGGNVNSNKRGGYGAYSVGAIDLEKGVEVYINVGGQGAVCRECNYAAGGYNGGGDGYEEMLRTGTTFSGGGGATHVSIISGELKNLVMYKDTGGTNISNEIFIVAAGGGGNWEYPLYNVNYYTIGYAEAGGIESAETESYNSDRKQYYTTIGANQNSGFQFGLGAIDETQGAGGGGGWYGGCTNYISATGGSSYIASSNLLSSNGITKHMTCYNCATSSVESTKTESNTCHNVEPTEDCAKEGNGYARITYIN